MAKRIVASNSELITEEYPFMRRFVDKFPQDLEKTIRVRRIDEWLLDRVPYTSRHRHNSTDFFNHGHRNRWEAIVLLGDDGNEIACVRQDDVTGYFMNSLLSIANLLRSQKIKGEQVKHAINRLEEPNSVKYILEILVLPGMSVGFTLYKLPKDEDMEDCMRRFLEERKGALLDVGD